MLRKTNTKMIDLNFYSLPPSVVLHTAPIVWVSCDVIETLSCEYRMEKCIRAGLTDRGSHTTDGYSPSKMRATYLHLRSYTSQTIVQLCIACRRRALLHHLAMIRTERGSSPRKSATALTCCVAMGVRRKRVYSSTMSFFWCAAKQNAVEQTITSLQCMANESNCVMRHCRSARCGRSNLDYDILDWKVRKYLAPMHINHQLRLLYPSGHAPRIVLPRDNFVSKNGWNCASRQPIAVRRSTVVMKVSSAFVHFPVKRAGPSSSLREAEGENGSRTFESVYSEPYAGSIVLASCCRWSHWWRLFRKLQLSSQFNVRPPTNISSDATHLWWIRQRSTLRRGRRHTCFGGMRLSYRRRQNIQHSSMCSFRTGDPPCYARCMLMEWSKSGVSVFSNNQGYSALADTSIRGAYS